MGSKIQLFTIVLNLVFFMGCAGNNRNAVTTDGSIKAFNIDYNWGPGGVHGFAGAGLYYMAYSL